MELRLVILSVACFSCLIPSAVSINLLAAKAVAGEAGQELVAIGARTLALKKEAILNAAAEIASIATQIIALKGQVMKNVAGSMAGAMISGAASIGATIAKAGLNMVAAKFGIKPIANIVFDTPVLQEPLELKPLELVPLELEPLELKPLELKPLELKPLEPIIVEYDREIQVPVHIPPISTVSVDVRPPVIDLPPPPQLSASWNTVYEVVPPVEFVPPAEVPCAYEIVETPQFYTGPLIETFHFGK